jgi:cytochrome c oxidase cbb3-type subunit II
VVGREGGRMNRYLVIFLGAVATVTFAFAVLVGVPRLQLAGVPAPAALRPYGEQETAGRALYVSLGCHYCHSQQVRTPSFGSDSARGWGRASAPADYVFDRPHLLGTMRTGPDLMNIGVRQPSRDWHYLHLYQPRAVSPYSVMPSFPFLFALKDQAEMGDEIVNTPPGLVPAGKVLVALPEARALVDYLLAMQHEYEPSAAAGGAP